MDSIVDSFLQEYSITDPAAKDSLIEVINSCFKVYAQYMSKDLLGSEGTTKAPKEPKTPKKTPKVPPLENPADATSLAQLGECTIQVLSKFCKEHSLKVGGKKDSVSLRVWRFLQGETSDEDRSVKGSVKSAKPAKEPVVPGGESPQEPRECCGMTKSGAQCVLAGTRECDGMWYCFRHLPKDSSNASVSSDSGESEEFDPETASSSSKTPKTPKTKTPKDKKNPKTPKVVELDSESE